MNTEGRYWERSPGGEKGMTERTGALGKFEKNIRLIQQQGNNVATNQANKPGY